jgi:hypothetical protein
MKKIAYCLLDVLLARNFDDNIKLRILPRHPSIRRYRKAV